MKTYLIILPGIFKRESFLKYLKSYSVKNNFEIEIYRIKWLGKNIFPEVMAELENKIKCLSRRGYRVSLIGTSAGAAVALNLFTKAELKVHKLVTICGPVMDASTLPFTVGKYLSPTWSHALKSCATVNIINAGNILTIIPKFDELVPVGLMNITGASVLKIPGYEHLHSITTATSDYGRNIIGSI